MALARALVMRPKVLLLDEPLGALDLKLREEMQGELKSLQRALGLTFVFVTHDQGEALSMADRVAVFNHGRIVQVGAPEEIYERPQTRFVADFVGGSNVIEPALVQAVDRRRTRPPACGRRRSRSSAPGAPAPGGCDRTRRHASAEVLYHGAVQPHRASRPTRGSLLSSPFRHGTARPRARRTRRARLRARLRCI